MTTRLACPPGVSAMTLSLRTIALVVEILRWTSSPDPAAAARASPASRVVAMAGMASPAVSTSVGRRTCPALQPGYAEMTATAPAACACSTIMRVRHGPGWTRTIAPAGTSPQASELQPASLRASGPAWGSKPSAYSGPVTSPEGDSSIALKSRGPSKVGAPAARISSTPGPSCENAGTKTGSRVTSYPASRSSPATHSDAAR
jgi:hypothetical protein